MTYQYGPAYPPVPPPYPAPPKKSKLPKVLLIAAIGIVMFAGVGSCIGGGGSDDSATSGQSTAAANVAGAPAEVATSQAPPPPPPGVNAPVRDGKFEFIVTKVQTGVTELGDNPYLHSTAQGTYTIVTMTVRNISDVPYGFSPGNQDLYDAQGRKFTNDPAAAINLQPDTSLYADINPGNTITAQIVYDIPADSQPDRLIVHDSMFSGGATISLR